MNHAFADLRIPYLRTRPSSSRPTPNLAKPGQAEPSAGQIFPRKRLGFPWFGLSEMSLFNGLSRPLGAKIFLSRDPPPTRPKGRGELGLAGVCAHRSWRLIYHGFSFSERENLEQGLSNGVRTTSFVSFIKALRECLLSRA
jgi:hypothetical protein